MCYDVWDIILGYCSWPGIVKVIIVGLGQACNYASSRRLPREYCAEYDANELLPIVWKLINEGRSCCAVHVASLIRPPKASHWRNILSADFDRIIPAASVCKDTQHIIMEPPLRRAIDDESAGTRYAATMAAQQWCVPYHDGKSLIINRYLDVIECRSTAFETLARWRYWRRCDRAMGVKFAVALSARFGKDIEWLVREVFDALTGAELEIVMCLCNVYFTHYEAVIASERDRISAGHPPRWRRDGAVEARVSRVTCPLYTDMIATLNTMVPSAHMFEELAPR